MRIPAIRLEQPIGELFICSIPYQKLEKISTPDALTLAESGSHLDGIYRLTGNQRVEVIQRRESIGNYISSVEATFPNTIILAANIDENGEVLDETNPHRWYAEYDERCGIWHIHIPTDLPYSRIIDGQHRVKGFKYASKRPENFDLPCAIFIDLSMPEQASIFATININQKKVDRSLAFNLFAYNLEEEPKELWDPEKLAIFFTRRLSVEEDSPLKGRIKVIARQGSTLYSGSDWIVSTSVFVDGIASLYSKKPSLDRNKLFLVQLKERNRKKLLGVIPDDSPFREVYLNLNDIIIYKAVYNFFSAAHNIIWVNDETRGFTIRTVGIQALFDFLRTLSYISIQENDISYEFYEKYLVFFKDVNFISPRFSANGQGRKMLRNFFFYGSGIDHGYTISENDIEFYQGLLDSSS